MTIKPIIKPIGKLSCQLDIGKKINAEKVTNKVLFKRILGLRSKYFLNSSVFNSYFLWTSSERRRLAKKDGFLKISRLSIVELTMTHVSQNHNVWNCGKFFNTQQIEKVKATLKTNKIGLKYIQQFCLRLFRPIFKKLMVNPHLTFSSVAQNKRQVPQTSFLGGT